MGDSTEDGAGDGAAGRGGMEGGGGARGHGGEDRKGDGIVPIACAVATAIILGNLTVIVLGILISCVFFVVVVVIIFL